MHSHPSKHQIKKLFTREPDKNQRKSKQSKKKEKDNKDLHKINKYNRSSMLKSSIEINGAFIFSINVNKTGSEK